ncbi:MAG TPA: FAD-dependent oxidoreductase [Candidatus Sulfotelmatobacter sp.]|nr:FAD-dependent oxidoreductase [Candidatus Sulfotelmatobacter sp.]
MMTDILVVGGGTAGSVIAARLVERTDARVTLLEAGPDPGPFQSGRWPRDLLDSNRIGTSHDWGYAGPAADGRTLAMGRARVVGGCSSHNGCTQSIGWRGDYDKWSITSPRWSAERLVSFLPDVVTRLKIRQPARTELQPLQEAFLDACVRVGIPHSDDLLDLDAGAAVSISPVNIHGSTRWNAAFAYLDPVRNSSRLEIIEHATVERVLISGDKAVGAAANIAGIRQQLFADKIVLCAGAYGSPEILLRSGIGPTDQLGALGVPIAIALDGVGANLHDHPVQTRTFAASADLARLLNLAGPIPDEQAVAKIASGCDPERAPYDLHLFPWTERNPDSPTGWSVTLPVGLLRPASRGRLTLRSSDPGVRALPDHSFLREASDATRLLAALPLVEELIRVLPLGPELSIPPRGDLEQWLRHNHSHYWHPAGTCAMGSNPTDRDRPAVVDHRGQVHGCKGLFVCDASIFPNLPRATPALPVVLAAEQIATSLLYPR